MPRPLREEVRVERPPYFLCIHLLTRLVQGDALFVAVVGLVEADGGGTQPQTPGTAVKTSGPSEGGDARPGTPAATPADGGAPDSQAIARLEADLAELGGEGALDALQAGLSSEDPALRQACLDALGALGDGRGSDVIAFALMDEDAAVRREAARLRKRFQLVKEKLRGWAQEEGLL